MTTVEFARKRRRKPGDIAALRRTLWAGLLEVEDLLASPDPNLKLRAAHALGTLAGTYLRAIEAHDLEQRLLALEAAVASNGNANLRRIA